MRKIFVWDPRNEEHIGEHRVSREEARYVVEHASGRYPQKIGSENTSFEVEAREKWRCK